MVQADSEKLADLFPALMLEAQRLAQTLASGFHGRKRAGQGENFWQHRPYISGDSVADIDWRQSARASNRLYIRQNEWESANAVWLWRDPSASMAYSSSAGTNEKRWRASVLTLALSILLSKGGERIGVLGARTTNDGQETTNESSRLFHGRNAPQKIIESMDHFSKTNTNIIPHAEKIRPGHHLVLVSDFLMDSEHVANAINFAQTKGAKGILCQILDRAEEKFPYQGRTEFLDMESSDRLLFGSAGSVRKDYQRVFAHHQESLKKISNSTGWPIITHFTDENAHNALIEIVNLLEEKNSTLGGNF